MDESSSNQQVQTPAAGDQTQVPSISPKKISKKILITITVIILILGSGSLYYLSSQKNGIQSKPEQKTISTTPSLSPTSSLPPTTLTEIQSIDKLNPSAIIKIPFVRDNNIYLYEDGQEKLVAKPARQTTQTACNNLVFPFLSPNGKYLAYIEQLGEQPGYGGCVGGVLRIVSLETGKNKPTEYKTDYLTWNADNNLEFDASSIIKASSGEGINPEESKVMFIIYNPSTSKEIARETLSYSESDDGLRGFPLYKDLKLIRYKGKKYYLVNKVESKETFLFNKEEIQNFVGWSPDGKYALFISTKRPPEEQNKPIIDIWLAVNADNPSVHHKEIKVYHGAAGGEFSVGLQWYFNEAFISYCSQHLTYLDGREPLELTNSGGGGCHNEDGFVATSPNQEYAFVKFSDRFELHKRNGEKATIKETKELAKGRGAPGPLIWVNENYMAIFDRAANYNDGTNTKPSVYLFDRKSNLVKPLIQNAYLEESLQ